MNKILLSIIILSCYHHTYFTLPAQAYRILTHSNKMKFIILGAVTVVSIKAINHDAQNKLQQDQPMTDQEITEFNSIISQIFTNNNLTFYSTPFKICINTTSNNDPKKSMDVSYNKSKRNAAMHLINENIGQILSPIKPSDEMISHAQHNHNLTLDIRPKEICLCTRSAFPNKTIEECTDRALHEALLQKIKTSVAK